MRNKLGIACILLGITLIAGSLVLFLRNQTESNTAAQTSADALTELIVQLDTVDPSQPPVVIDIPEALLTAEDLEMTETVVDGNAYIGYLTIPALGLELPILSDWNYDLLQIAPCRYCGSVRGRDLVLMAHNYESHFGQISQLSEGDALYFTDMDGVTTEYQLVAQDILAPNAVEEMTAGVFDLTLFTCTYGGQSRVVVYANQASE